MAIDAYVKFGESKDLSPLFGTPLPLIEGDSDDSEHYWWCELRDCGFELEAPERDSTEKGESNDPKKPRPGFKPVRLKKRVDWGSTQLFIKCCEAAQATSPKKSGDEKKGVIDQVTVHICRPSGGKKIPFLIVTYYGVRVTNFKIGMAGAESSEEITFEFDELEFEYQRTDPYTGLKKGEADITRPRLKNYPPAKEPAVGETGGVNPSVTPSAGGTGGPGTVGGVTSSGGPAGNGQHPGIATPTDLSLLANFPGAAPLNGPGVLQQT